jgi:hypothetical protein
MGLAAMGKLHAFVALPVLALRIGWRGRLATLAVVAVCLLPFLGAGSHLMEGVQSMAQYWDVNASLYPLLLAGCRFAGRGPFTTRVLCGMLLVLGLLLLARPPSGESTSLSDVYRRLGYAFLMGYLLSPALQPWYLIWIAPFAALTRTASLLVFTSVVTLWYLGGTASALSYVPVYVCLAVEGWQAWRNRNRTLPS